MKTISTMTMLAALCMGLQAANAGLLGMPLNLKATIGHVDIDTSTGRENPSREFLTDEVPLGPVLVISC